MKRTGRPKKSGGILRPTLNSRLLTISRVINKMKINLDWWISCYIFALSNNNKMKYRKNWEVGDDIFLPENGEKYWGKVVSVDGSNVTATFGSEEPFTHPKKNLVNVSLKGRNKQI